MLHKYNSLSELIFIYKILFLYQKNEVDQAEIQAGFPVKEPACFQITIKQIGSSASSYGMKSIV